MTKLKTLKNTELISSALSNSNYTHAHMHTNAHTSKAHSYLSALESADMQTFEQMHNCLVLP